MAASSESETHDCEWRARAEALLQKLAGLEQEVAELRPIAARAEELAGQVTSLKDAFGKLQHEMETLTRRLLGPKSEKLPPVTRELREGAPVDFEAVLKKWRERQKAKAEVAKETWHYPVPEAPQRCPKCGNDQLRPLGEGNSQAHWMELPLEQFLAYLRQVYARPELKARFPNGF